MNESDSVSSGVQTEVGEGSTDVDVIVRGVAGTNPFLGHGVDRPTSY